MRKILTYSAIAAASLAVISCGRKDSSDAEGTFEAVEVTVSAESTGRILSFDVQEGDDLQEGQVVGAIDSVQIYLQKLQLEKQVTSVRTNKPVVGKQIAAIQDQIDKAEKEKTRVENLLKDGAATSKQLDDVESQLAVLRSQLDASRTSLRNAAASVDASSSAIDLQIAQAEDRLLKCRIVSPVKGKVLAKYSEAGEMAVAGKPLMKVADVDKMFLRAYFTSSQLADLKIGQAVKVIADFGGGRQKTYPGKVTWISEESEFTPKSIQTKDSRANLVYAVKIAVDNDGYIKIGFAGKVIL